MVLLEKINSICFKYLVEMSIDLILRDGVNAICRRTMSGPYNFIKKIKKRWIQKITIWRFVK